MYHSFAFARYEASIEGDDDKGEDDDDDDSSKVEVVLSCPSLSVVLFVASHSIVIVDMFFS